MLVIWSDDLMVSWLKMFGKIIGKVFLPRMPCDVEISNFDLIGDPKEILLHCARALFLDCVVCNGHCCAIVAVYWSGRLLMSQFFECESQYCSVLTVVEECA